MAPSEKNKFTPLHADILRASLAMDKPEADAEDIRRELYGLDLYPKWQIDMMRINVAIRNLRDWNYLAGGQTGFWITERGIERISEN